MVEVPAYKASPGEFSSSKVPTKKANRIRMGVHVSIAGSIDRAVDRAAKRGCDTFQIFSRNPRGWRLRDLSEEVAAAFSQKLEASGMGPPVDHMPYLPNLASPREDVYTKSIDALEEEVRRCGRLGIPYLVTHLGSHLGMGKGYGIGRIVEAVDSALSRLDDQSPKNCRVTLLLENTSGTKNSVGGDLEYIGRIIDALGSEDVGLCLDTCHAFAAGYEIRSQSGLAATLEEVDMSMGMDRLRLVHLNDCKGDLGSKLDRHEHIGLGGIGLAGFRNIIRHEAFRKLPMILETPVDERRDDVGNLEVARSLA